MYVIMATNANREAAVANLIKAFHRAFPERGFQIHPCLHFIQTDALGIDAQVNGPISKDDVLLVIPESSMFSLCNLLDVDEKNHDDSGSHSTFTVLHHMLTRVEALSGQVLDSMAQNFTYIIDEKEVALSLLVCYVRAKLDRGGPLFRRHGKCIWSEQAATWPSEKEMIRDSPLYWTEEDRAILGVSFARQHMKSIADQIQYVFERAIKPILMNNSPEVPLQDFVLPCVKERMLTEEDELWGSFCYGFSIVYSRCHEGPEFTPELSPLVDLLNGLSSVCDDDINVDYVTGKWPFIRGALFRDDFDLDCSALYAKCDVEAGSSLIISYGPLTPSGYLSKYGTVPLVHVDHPDNMVDSVNLLVPPHFLPNKELDNLRYICLEGQGFQLERLRKGEPLIFLSGRLADISAVQHTVGTGIVTNKYDKTELCRLLVDVCDYTIAMLSPSSSADDTLRSKSGDASSKEAAALFCRIAQRQTLQKWRDAFCQNYRYSPHQLID